MKKIVSIIISLMVISNILNCRLLYAEDDLLYLPDSEGNKVADDAIALWKEDSNTILQLIKDLRPYEKNDNDTEIQRNERDEAMRKAIRKLTSQLKGKQIKLNRVEVMSVGTMKRFSYLNEDKDMKEKAYIDKHKYFLFFEIPVPGDILARGIYEEGLNTSDLKSVKINIIKIANDKNVALKFNKNAAGEAKKYLYQIKGKFVLIHYDSLGYYNLYLE